MFTPPQIALLQIIFRVFASPLRALAFLMAYITFGSDRDGQARAVRAD